MTPTDSPHHYTAEELHNPDVAHDPSDVNVRAILLFGVGMVVVTVVSAIIIWILFGMLERQAAANDPQVSPLALPAGRRPPAPTLQVNEPARLAKFREEQHKTLESYGWVDQPGGVARIPIAEAKKLMLERGLPVRSGAATDDDGRLGTHAYAMGGPSSGRTLVRPKAAPSTHGDVKK